MRLWHKDLIPVLPRQQLLGQWRECCAIARNISIKGAPNHILVDAIMAYPREQFWTYCMMVYDEMHRRGYKADYQKIKKWISAHDTREVDPKFVFRFWHNDRYLKQCLYNLQEKYDCGGISDDEWKIITEKWEVD